MDTRTHGLTDTGRPKEGTHHRHLPLSKASQEGCRVREAVDGGTREGPEVGPSLLITTDLNHHGQELGMARTAGPWVVGEMHVMFQDTLERPGV